MPAADRRRCRESSDAACTAVPGIGGTERNKNALKHGTYTREAFKQRAEVDVLFNSFKSCSKKRDRNLSLRTPPQKVSLTRPSAAIRDQDPYGQLLAPWRGGVARMRSCQYSVGWGAAANR